MKSRIFVDTAPLIYWLDGREPFATMARNFFINSIISDFFLLTSTITDAEILVYPYKNLDLQKVEDYNNFLSNLGIEKICIDETVADKAARLRAKYKFMKTADSLQLAASICSNCDIFLTNDKQLLQVSEVSATLLENI